MTELCAQGVHLLHYHPFLFLFPELGAAPCRHVLLSALGPQASSVTASTTRGSAEAFCVQNEEDVLVDGYNMTAALFKIHTEVK